jgi:hypothetical protein
MLPKGIEKIGQKAFVASYLLLPSKLESTMKKPLKKQHPIDQLQRIYIYSKQRSLKTQILNRLCEEYKLHRKSVIRRLNQVDKPKKQRPGRKPTYSADVLLPALTKIWLATDMMCGKRLKRAIPLWLPFYESTDEPLPKKIKAQLLGMSPAVIDRLLKPIKIKSRKRGISGTKPGRLLKNQIAIKTDHWDVTAPGFVEADTVAHCGNSVAGEFVWSVTLTDIFSGWTEIRATWNKGEHGVTEQIKDIESHLPFILRGFDCDNGSEFLNWHLIRYLKERKENSVQVTRSRPYRKNDNAHVEQKNWTHVRHLFGYDRFEHSFLVAMMNDLYKNEWSLLINYFYPSMQLKEKTKINSKYIRRYHEPKTPYQRLMECDQIDRKSKAILRKRFEDLNPFELKEIIEKKLKDIFKFVKISNKVRRRI